MRFIFKVPMTTVSVNIKDRQLIMDQQLWRDFPEKDSTTIYYESVAEDKQWPTSENLINLPMRRLAYILTPKDGATQLTILAALEVPANEKGWIVNMTVTRAPFDWCQCLAIAVANYENGVLKIDARSQVDTPRSNYI